VRAYPYGVRQLLALLSFPLLALAACSEAPAGGDGTDDDLNLGGRWDVSEESYAKMRTFSIPYDGPGPRCLGGFSSGAKDLGTMLSARFASAIRRNEGYACRANTANANQLSMHAMGRAVDVMMADVSNSARGQAAGKRIADYLLLNADLLGAQYIIWNRTKCNMSQRSCGRYSGPNPHTDHIHVELTEAAGAGNAPFYQGTPLRDGTVTGGGVPPEPGGGGGVPPEPGGGGGVPPEPGGGEPAGGGRGGPCTADLDCASSQWCSTRPASDGMYHCCDEGDTTVECRR
jgi:hypothetical protein